MPNGVERCEASLQHKGQDLSPQQDRSAAEVLLRLLMTAILSPRASAKRSPAWAQSEIASSLRSSQ